MTESAWQLIGTDLKETDLFNLTVRTLQPARRTFINSLKRSNPLGRVSESRGSSKARWRLSLLRLTIF
jgi:hypothetical protein